MSPTVLRGMRNLFGLGALCCGMAGPALAVDWQSAEEVEVVRILTTNEDGSVRNTKIWIVVVEGQAYIRTGATRWFDNVERNPDVVLEIESHTLPLRAERVTDGALIERLQAVFREKYGFQDRMVGLIRFGGPRMFRLVERTPTP